MSGVCGKRLPVNIASVCGSSSAVACNGGSELCALRLQSLVPGQDSTPEPVVSFSRRDVGDCSAGLQACTECSLPSIVAGRCGPSTQVLVAHATDSSGQRGAGILLEVTVAPALASATLDVLITLSSSQRTVIADLFSSAVGSAECSGLASGLHDILHALLQASDACQFADAADSSHGSAVSSSEFVLSVEVSSLQPESPSYTGSSAQLQLMLDVTLGAQATAADATVDSSGLMDAATAAAVTCLQSLDTAQGSELRGLPMAVFPTTSDGGSEQVPAFFNGLQFVSVQTQAATCPQQSDADKSIDLEVARLQEGIVEFLVVDSAVCHRLPHHHARPASKF